MAINAGSDILATDFVSTSSGASDEGKVAKLNADGQIPAGFLTAPLNVQEFPVSGTWTKPGGGTFAFVECWGGGGSGGARQASSEGRATGGSGGEYVSGLFPFAYLPSSITVTIGAGGALVAITSGAGNGNDGNNTTFGSLLTANKGIKGTGVDGTGTTTGVAGGTGGSATFLETKKESGGASASASSTSVGTGSVGTPGATTYAGAGAGSAQRSISTGNNANNGATSTYGGNGGNGAFNNAGSATASAGESKGGGGGGAHGSSGTTTSGKGGNGFCRVTVF